MPNSKTFVQKCALKLPADFDIVTAFDISDIGFNSGVGEPPRLADRSVVWSENGFALG